MLSKEGQFYFSSVLIPGIQKHFLIKNFERKHVDSYLKSMPNASWVFDLFLWPTSWCFAMTPDLHFYFSKRNYYWILKKMIQL